MLGRQGGPEHQDEGAGDGHSWRRGPNNAHRSRRTPRAELYRKPHEKLGPICQTVCECPHSILAVLSWLFAVGPLG